MKLEHSASYRGFDNLCQKLGHAPQVRSFETATRLADTPSPSAIRFIVSTGGVKRDGHMVEQDGWKLDAYRSNPVVLWAHNSRALPIGKSIDIKLESIRGKGKCLVSTDEWETHSFASEVRGLYERGTLNAVSAGWAPIKYEFLEGEDGYYTGIRFVEQELLEHSCVPVPADPDALKRAFTTGTLSRDLLDSFTINRAFGQRDEDTSGIYYLDFPSLSAPETRTWVEVNASADSDAGTEESLELRDLEPTENGGDADAGDDLEFLIIPERDGAVLIDEHPPTMPSPDDSWDPAGARSRIAHIFAEDIVHRTGLIYDKENDREYGLHHDVVDRELVTNPRALAMAAQRYLRGEYSVEEGSDDARAIEAHLDAELEMCDMGLRCADSLSGMYRSVMSNLRKQDLTETEVDFYRGVAVDVAKRIFGKYRLLESWEPTGDVSSELARSIASRLNGPNAEWNMESAEAIVREAGAEIRKAALASKTLAEMLRITGFDNTSELLSWARSEFEEGEELDISSSISRLSSVICKENDDRGLDETEDFDIKDNEGTPMERLSGLLSRLLDD